MRVESILYVASILHLGSVGVRWYFEGQVSEPAEAEENGHGGCTHDPVCLSVEGARWYASEASLECIIGGSDGQNSRQKRLGCY